MSVSRFIKEILDFNIIFHPTNTEETLSFYSKEFYEGEPCHFFKGTLSYTPDCCSKYWEENNHPIIKWGFKTVVTQ